MPQKAAPSSSVQCSKCFFMCVRGKFLHPHRNSSFLLTQSIRLRSPRLRAVQTRQPTLACASSNQAAKAAMSDPERMESYSINLALFGVIEGGYSLPLKCRMPHFNSVAQSLTLPRNALVLRQEVCSQLGKGVIERVTPSKLESGSEYRFPQRMLRNVERKLKREHLWLLT